MSADRLSITVDDTGSGRERVGCRCCLHCLPLASCLVLLTTDVAAATSALPRASTAGAPWLRAAAACAVGAVADELMSSCADAKKSEMDELLIRAFALFSPHALLLRQQHAHWLE